MCGSVSPFIIQFLTGYPENLNVIQLIHTGWPKTIIKDLTSLILKLQQSIECPVKFLFQTMENKKYHGPQ